MSDTRPAARPDVGADAAPGRLAPVAPGRRRRVQVFIVMATVLACLGAVATAMSVIDRSGEASFSAALKSWDEPVDGMLPAKIEIRRDADLALSCELIAMDQRFIIVGQTTVDVPAGPEEHLVVDAAIPLEGDGIVPELRGCTPANP